MERLSGRSMRSAESSIEDNIEQSVWVTSGLMDLRIGAEHLSCGPGDIAVIPGGVGRQVWFCEDTEVVDVPSRRSRISWLGWFVA